MLVGNKQLLYEGLRKLLAVKDSDLRISILQQGLDAVDKGIHAGGAFSSVVPLVSLFYGGIIEVDVENPTRSGQDVFILSKGHAVASMASIYADLGYFTKDVLQGSRSIESILNGHPGPILPGVAISTGPLGQGACVAEGFAIAGKLDTRFNVYALLGDGELQEGIVWEAIMYAPQKNLDNLCFIVDNNRGQLDKTDGLLVDMDNLAGQFGAFGWNVIEVNAEEYGPVHQALLDFKQGEKDGRPTVIICHTNKGSGAFGSEYTGHKITVNQRSAMVEMDLQKQRRNVRERDYILFRERYAKNNPSSHETLVDFEQSMRYTVDNRGVRPFEQNISHIKPVPRKKSIQVNEQDLPKIEHGKAYSASSIIEQAMGALAIDPHVVSIDADLSSTSGLAKGVGAVDRRRALNVGIAEANMMNIGEAFAVLGYNVWMSTFCPFFDMKVLRRIAVGQQERLEAIQTDNGWLSEGHGLDITMLATAPNLETKTNGATHMGNDDMGIIRQYPNIKIIDIGCPKMLLEAVKWVMEGNRGLVYLRILRSPSLPIHGEDFKFSFGTGYYAKKSPNATAVIVSSGRGVYEAIGAQEYLKEQEGIDIDVIDMPSVDKELLISLLKEEKLILFAEQNNGFLWSECQRITYTTRRNDVRKCITVNTSDAFGEPQFIHSGTYEELVHSFGLDAKSLAETIKGAL